MKRPAFQFYPADWRKDPALQSCSIAARGLWLECMNLMHEAEPYGHLVVNAKPMNAAQIGRLVGVPPRECAHLLQELIDAGVPSITDAGIIYSRRMVRDEELRNRRAEGGKEGSEHGFKGAEYGSKGGRPPKATGENKPPLKPPPSSSASSSPSASTKGLNGHANDFNEFWQAYPLHIGRPKAEQAFAKALERADVSLIVAGARHYANTRKDQDKKFTKHPATWLNDDGWLDGAAQRLTPEQDAASRDKADRLMRRGKYAEQAT